MHNQKVPDETFLLISTRFVTNFEWNEYLIILLLPQLFKKS